MHSQTSLSKKGGFTFPPKTKKVNSLTTIAMGSGGNEKLPRRRFTTVRMVLKVWSTPTQLSYKLHHSGGAVCPSYGMVSIDTPKSDAGNLFRRKGEGVVACINSLTA
jgi:hypothetical protein